MQACEMVGLPECQLTLSQTVAYLATAPKSNAATVAIGEARRDVREHPLIPVPLHLRDAHYAGARQMGHGAGYIYPHSHPEQAADQQYFDPEPHLGYRPRYYRPR
jgi:putative ATPase